MPGGADAGEIGLLMAGTVPDQSKEVSAP